MRKVAQYSVLTASIIGIAVVLFLLFRLLSPLDSLGRTDERCDTRGDFPSVPNHTGIVATAHETGCAIVLLSTEFTTYVYVHRAGEEDSARSLVFRFYESPNSFDCPKIVWINDSSLYISVSDVGEVTKQLNSMDGVKISYFVGKEVFSREEDLRESRRWATVLFVWLISLTGVCFLTIRSIKKQKRSDPLRVAGK